MVPTNNVPRYAASPALQPAFVKNADSCGDNLFTQIQASGNVYIYSRTDTNTGKVVGFEVFTSKVVKAGTTFVKGGKPTEADYESYPGKTSFGKTAWFCSNLERATTRFNSIVTGQTVVESDDETEAAIVPVVRVEPVATKKVTVTIPVGEFTQAQFAVANNLPERGVVWSMLDTLKTRGFIKESKREKVGPGRPTVFYISNKV